MEGRYEDHHCWLSSPDLTTKTESWVSWGLPIATSLSRPVTPPYSSLDANFMTDASPVTFKIEPIPFAADTATENLDC